MFGVIEICFGLRGVASQTCGECFGDVMRTWRKIDEVVSCTARRTLRLQRELYGGVLAVAKRLLWLLIAVFEMCLLWRTREICEEETT